MDIEAQFIAFLQKKRIDPEAFRTHEAAQWQAFLELFGQVSEKSFTQQKLFLINNLRRRYHLPEPPKPAPKPKAEAEQTAVKPKAKVRRVVRRPAPKIKVKKKEENPDESNTATPPDSPAAE